MFNPKDFNEIVNLCTGLLIVFVPLGMWKIVEIIIDVFKHLRWE